MGLVGVAKTFHSRSSTSKRLTYLCLVCFFLIGLSLIYYSEQNTSDWWAVIGSVVAFVSGGAGLALGAVGVGLKHETVMPTKSDGFFQPGLGQDGFDDFGDGGD